MADRFRLWSSSTDTALLAPDPIEDTEKTREQLLAELANLRQQIAELRNTTVEHQVQKHTMQLQRALEFETLLKQVSDKLRKCFDEQQILSIVVQELAQGLDMTSCRIGLYEPQAESPIGGYQKLEVHAALPESPESIDRPSTDPERYTQLLAGQYLYCCLSMPSLDRRAATRWFTLLACPLIEEQSVIGDLWLYRPADTCFDQTEIRLVQQVAEQAAIALRQSRLHHTTQAQLEELARVSQLKDEFLSSLSHEFRTPISSIKMATQLLELHLTDQGVLKADSPTSRYFQILQDECQREINLINNLLDLSRLTAASEPLILSTLPPQIWIPHVVEPFEPQIRQHNQQLQLDIPPDLPPLVTDFSYLERILTELLTNACKYTPAGEQIIVSAQALTPADAGSRVSAGQLRVQVTNTGVEIPEKDYECIFDKLYRIPGQDLWQHRGAGLGLALVRNLVNHLQGAVWVESGANCTTFTVQLPLAVTAAS